MKFGRWFLHQFLLFSTQIPTKTGNADVSKWTRIFFRLFLVLELTFQRDSQNTRILDNTKIGYVWKEAFGRRRFDDENWSPIVIKWPEMIVEFFQ